METIIIATPHKRNDRLVSRLAKRLSGFKFMRITSRHELSLETLTRVNPKWVFFPHWSWLIPQEIYNRYECVIFHMTDLPYGRGGSPLQNLIIRGHRTTRLTALKCVANLDAGPIYLKMPLSLEGTAEAILQRAANLMESMIVDIVEKQPTPIPQCGEVVEFKRRRPEDSDIHSLETLEQVYDYIRMLDAEGYPPAFVQTAHLRYEFSEVQSGGEWLEARVRIRKRDDD